MEIVVISKLKLLNEEFIPMIDQILYEKKIKRLSLYDQVIRFEEIKRLPVSENYLFFVDVQEELTSNAIKMIETVMSQFPRSCMVLLIDNGINVLNIVNSIGTINGIINFHWEWKNQLTDILKTIGEKMEKICKGILIFHYNMDRLIPYEDIYYIETIKSTHCCMIRHKHGEEKLRANIKDLIEQLDGRFEIVHASTIANLSLVKKVDRKNRCLHFTDEVNCGYSNACAKKIRNRMQEFV
ncbi:MAG: LytTR family transcriptional regulator [Lachnospiraceae bacterium]|nr:LytTR family transcriptional regulator [Lachnospiraceae bacterium]